MILTSKQACTALCVLILSVSISAISTDAAPKKINAVKKKEHPKADAVPKDRVLREFNAVYQDPPASKKIKAYHTGTVRRYTETRGSQQIPAQAHQVALTVKLADCGITMRDIWEVYFYKLETEWIFQDIMQVRSAQLTRTKNKHPPLDDATSIKIISDGLMKKYDGLRVEGITVLGKKSMWRLCVPEYQVKIKISADMKNEIYNTVTAYECLMVSTLAHENGKWELMQSSCVYRGKEIADCHIGTMCRELGTDSTIPAIHDADASRLLQDSFEREYGLKKNNISVEKFDIVKKLPIENFGKKRPFAVEAVFVIDEIKETAGGAESPRHTMKVRAVYKCLVSGYLNYSLSKNKWEGIIESCCPSGSEPCGIPCSDPDKGCKRLGEK